MNKFIAFSFLVLGVGFYELSGGSEFTPEVREASAPKVARAQTLETVAPTLAEPTNVTQAEATPEQRDVQLASFRADKPAAALPKIDLSKFDALAEPEPEVEKPSDATAVVVQSELPQTPGLQLDEDMLRDLVGDIVRQELQGALGERITRNVRKLVRREIHRMLISQEME